MKYVYVIKDIDTRDGYVENECAMKIFSASKRAIETIEKRMESYIDLVANIYKCSYKVTEFETMYDLEVIKGYNVVVTSGEAKGEGRSFVGYKERVY